MNLKLGHIEIFAKNSQASKEFYEKIGFETFEVQGGGKFVWMKSGESVLLIRPGERKELPFNESKFDLVIYTDNVEDAKEKISSLGVKIEEVDGCSGFRDHDGNWFQLVNPEEQH